MEWTGLIDFLQLDEHALENARYLERLTAGFGSAYT